MARCATLLAPNKNFAVPVAKSFLRITTTFVGTALVVSHFPVTTLVVSTVRTAVRASIATSRMVSASPIVTLVGHLVK